MKKLLFALFLPALMLAACSEDRGEHNIRPDDGQVQFSGGMAAVQQTKVGGEDGTLWDGGEQVGIFMLKNGGTTVADVLVANAAYTASAGATANLTAAGDPIYYPTDGSDVQFISYYPYNAAVTDTFTLPVSVADQSNQSNIDVLYSAAGDSYNNVSGTVNLGYEHQLSKLTFIIQPGADMTLADLAGATVTIGNQQTAAEMAYDGTLTVTAGTPTTIEALTEANGQSSQAIVLPGTTDGVIFTVTTADGRAFTTEPSTVNASWDSGYQYDYTIALGEGGATMATLTGTIAPWGDGGSYQLIGEEGGEEPPVGPELTITMKQGDPDGKAPTTTITALIVAPTAVHCTGYLDTTDNIDAIMAQGLTYDDILDAAGQNLDGYMPAINNPDQGLAYYISTKPLTSVTAIVRVEDAAGASTTKAASGTTADPGPATTQPMPTFNFAEIDFVGQVYSNQQTGQFAPVVTYQVYLDSEADYSGDEAFLEFHADLDATGAEIPTGTYTVMDGMTLEDFVPFAMTQGDTYGDPSCLFTADGGLVPFMAGTVEVSHSGTTYTFVMNLTDLSTNTTYTGTYTGEATIYDYTQMSMPTPKHAMPQAVAPVRTNAVQKAAVMVPVRK